MPYIYPLYPNTREINKICNLLQLRNKMIWHETLDISQTVIAATKMMIYYQSKRDKDN